MSENQETQETQEEILANFQVWFRFLLSPFEMLRVAVNFMCDFRINCDVTTMKIDEHVWQRDEKMYTSNRLFVFFHYSVCD